MTDRHNSATSGQLSVNELQNATGRDGRRLPPAGGSVSQVLGKVLAHPDDHGHVGELRLQSEHRGIGMWTEEQHCVTPAEFLAPEPR